MKKILILFAAVVAIVYSACKKETVETVTYEGTLQVRLTDAPAVYDSVIVEIVGVEVHSSPTNGWISINVPNPGRYDLLQYSNGLDTLIATSTLPAGNVSQIRLILGANNTVTKNGVTYPLVIPSGSESGLKLQIHKEIIGGTTNVVLLDFDANRSVVEQGNGVFHLKPVIHCVTIGIDGSISGSTSPVFQGIAYAFLGSDTFSTTINSSGNFLIGGVPAGVYTVCIIPDTIYQDTCFSNVVVGADSLTDLGLIQF